MNRRACVSLLLAMVVAARLAADEPPAQPQVVRLQLQAVDNGKPSAEQESQRLAAEKSAAESSIAQIDKIVGLTDVQKKAMADIIAARNRATRELQAANSAKIQAAGTALSKAFQDKDQAAIAKAQKEYQELFAPMQEAAKKCSADQAKVLTDEQKVKLHKHRLTTMIAGNVAPIQLTEAQVTEIETTCKDVPLENELSAFEGFGGWGGGPNLYVAVHQAVQKVLTAEQKDALARHRVLSPLKMSYAAADLTLDQWKQAEAAYDALAAQPKPDQDTRQFYQQLNDKIASLLTDEQKEKLKQARSAARAVGAQLKPGSAIYAINPAPGEPRGAAPAGPNPPGGVITRVVEAQLINLQLIAPQGSDKSAAASYIESIDKAVQLNDEQKQKITAIIEARDKANQEAQKQMQQNWQKAQSDLNNVLTADQQARLLESRLTGMIQRQTSPVELSDEQIKQVKAACQETTDHEALERKLHEALEKVLTAEQKTTIKKHRALSYVKMAFWQVKLTDDQLKKVEAAYEALSKDATVKPEAIFQRLFEKAQEVLTDEQKELLKKARPYGNQGFGGGFAPGGTISNTGTGAPRQPVGNPVDKPVEKKP